MSSVIPQFSCDLHEGVDAQSVELFTQWLWPWYEQNRRSFVWRDTVTPYGVFVSEVMLQQTQTVRVAQKFVAFLDKFPSFEKLAEATNAEILAEWQGLGYNRRALYLRDAARLVMSIHGGVLPAEEALLFALPGIGPATAASIRAFAFNQRSCFVETNIRTVLLAVFFPDKTKVADRFLLHAVDRLLPENNFRDWYYAMTDLGVYIKKTIGNHNCKSAAYTRQSRFEGSRRQVRGGILRELLALPHQTAEDLAIGLQRSQEEVKSVLVELAREGFIAQNSQELWACVE